MKLPSIAMKRKNANEHKEIQEVMYEKLFFHDMFGEQHFKLFTILVCLCMLDITAFQTFFQLIVYIFLQLMMFLWINYHSKYQAVIGRNNIIKILRVIQFLHMVQLILIYVCNIPLIFVKLDAEAGTKRWLMMFGILFPMAEDKVDSTIPFIDQIDNYERMGKLILSSFIIVLASMVISSI